MPITIMRWIESENPTGNWMFIKSKKACHLFALGLWKTNEQTNESCLIVYFLTSRDAALAAGPHAARRSAA